VAEDDVAAGDDRSRHVHYVDLVLGAWRPREAAFQLAAGLDVALQPIDGAGEAVAVVGAQTIDIEAAGAPLVNQAWDDASRIAETLPGGAVIVVLAPRFDLPMRAENEWFFLFLRRLGQAVVVIGKEPPMTATGRSPFERRRSVVEPEWEIRPDEISAERMRLLRFFPGLLPKAIAEDADVTGEAVSLIPAGPGHFLIPTGYRDTDPGLAPRDFDALEALEARDDGVKALAQTFCTSHFADAATLIDLALRFFRAGSTDLALGLIGRARTVARNPDAVARCELARQEIALFERRYSDVTAAPALSPRAPAPCVEKRRRLAEWADFASGNLSAAEDIVAPTLKHLRGTGGTDVDDIRRLELIARGRQASGDLDGALTLARSVAAALDHAGDAADQRLVFANAIGLARLHAARHDSAAETSEIERAFATALGGRNTGDILMMNVLLARADRGPVSEIASRRWLRAALVWLAHEPHEGLSRDAVAAVTGKADMPPGEIDGEVSGALADGLERTWPAIASRRPGRPPNFRSSASLPRLSSRRMFGGPGAAVLWTAESMVAPPPTLPRARLVKLVIAALAEICPPFAKAEGGTVTVDTNLGVDVPASREEALSVALRTGIEEFTFGEEVKRLDSAERARLSGDLEVRLSPIVKDVADAVGTIAVTFKRYLPEVRLSGAEARVVAHLRNGGRNSLAGLPMVAGISMGESDAVLRRLEPIRVIRADIRSA
jgi:hypothetical protein